MMTPREIRDLACYLIAYEDTAGKASEPTGSASLRVYEKLRQSLSEVAGTAAFQSFAARALALARSVVPRLETVRVADDGTLAGLSSHQPDEESPDQAGLVLIAQILGLLHTFLGEALTLSLLRDTWPDAAFDDRNSGNGRKA